ncbi:bifunctional SDR family oxidoreductase/M16 family metallopeptidase [Aspergillus saccharolyticus JOP 1030-1]|uniref:mitochondrial processing peptidase n=1 Tax=Aspergillus saccharolyticus JOP 1030-1 TaxID=1450539 RepID=A0A318ZQF2_9EURO|nr:putative mitochondrial processing peptidase beta subunit [Aspergillus saccharolyticus JOP 1030-1]PYH42338.1 putative mitochondrial processing peptidase beta subunit [Aspergillus saccharolyticus JOP 1030-1]
MSIIITGASGYVGQELAAALLSTYPDITVTLTDVVKPTVPASATQHASRARCLEADLTSPAAVDETFTAAQPFDTVYLLHGIMSSGSEANFELGMRVNLDATRHILDRLRTVTPGVKVVFTSSLAVYGPAPAGFVIDETNFPPIPSSSYGSQKLIIETLLNDYSRRGFLDGRAVRLPTVTVRAGKPTQAASSFASDIIREPFHGRKAVLPVGKETQMWICSPLTVVRNLLHAREVPTEAFGDSSRAVNLPGLLVSVQEMLDALEEVGGKERRALVEERYDADIDRIVQTWTPNFNTARALRLGFVEDVSMMENIRQYASRRLAFNFNQALRSRAALKAVQPVKRGFASPVTLPSSTQTTTLSNGFTIATEHSPWAQTSTVGVWIDAGSRAETDKTNGTAHFLEHLAFKGTNKRSQHQLELEIENMGAHLNAYTSRENTVYYAKSFNNDVPKAVDILADILQNSKLEPGAIERERDVILREQEEVDKQLEEVVFDHLHATAFQQQPLGRTILGPKENIQTISRDNLVDYIKTNYTADRMVLVGAGGIPHEQLVRLAEEHFGSLPSKPPTSAALALTAEQKRTPEFIGSEVRIRDDTLPTAHIALAVEGVSWKDDDYFTALVAQAIVGNWDRAMGNSPYLGSKLSSLVEYHGLANSFMSFSTSYSDTGLWGIYLVSENLTNLDDLCHFALREWSRLSFSVTPAEVERAKAQLKASILLSLDGTTAVAEDIGRQIITTGRRLSPEDVERTIGQITEKHVMDFAQRKLWDQDIAMSAVGSIEGILDYQRLRSDMSRNAS